MRTKILLKGEALDIKDAQGMVTDDFGHPWVSVKGTQKAWHFRLPPGVEYDEAEYEEKVEEVKRKAKMSEWHITKQNLLQRIWPQGRKEVSLDGARRTDFMVGDKVFEVQYSELPDNEPFERTQYWADKGYDVTWILASKILNQRKYEPNVIWHGESFETANFPTKRPNKWIKPLEIPGTTVVAALPLFEWGKKVEVRKDAQQEERNKGKMCLYRFYDLKYEKTDWGVHAKVLGGCTFSWVNALKNWRGGGRMYREGFWDNRGEN